LSTKGKVLSYKGRKDSQGIKGEPREALKKRAQPQAAANLGIEGRGEEKSRGGETERGEK